MHRLAGLTGLGDRPIPLLLLLLLLLLQMHLLLWRYIYIWTADNWDAFLLHVNTHINSASVCLRIAKFIVRVNMRQSTVKTASRLQPNVIMWLHFKCSVQYRPNLPLLISDIRALWRSGLSARVPECQKLKMVG